MTGFASMYEMAKADTPKGRTPLRQFQIVLSETPSWNQSRIDAEVKRICRDSSESYLEDLITTILVSNAEILSSINLHGKTNKIQLKIPKVGNFVHAVYVCVARRLFKEIYVFDEEAKATDKQRNMRRCEEIVREAILTVLQDNLPIHDIIRQYVTGGGDAKEAIEEVSDLLEDPDAVPEAISPESVSIIEHDAELQEGEKDAAHEDEEDLPQDDEVEDAPASAEDPGSPVEVVEMVTATTEPVGEELPEEVESDTPIIEYPGDAVGRVDRQIGRGDDDEDSNGDDLHESDADQPSRQDVGELVAMELPSSAHDESTQTSEQGNVPVAEGDDTNGSIVIDTSDVARNEDPDNDDDTVGCDSEEAADGSDEDARDVPAPRVGAGREVLVDELPKMVITTKDEQSPVEHPESTKGSAEVDDERASSDPSNAGTNDVSPISDDELEDYEFTDDELMSDCDDMGELIKRIKTGTVDGPSKEEVFFGDLVPKKKQTAELVQGAEQRKDVKGKRTSVSSRASSSDGGLTDGDSKRIILDSADLESDDQVVKRPRRRRAKKRIQLFPDAKSDTAAED